MIQRVNYIFVIISSIILQIFSFKEITPKLCRNCKYFIKDNRGREFSKCNVFLLPTSINDRVLLHYIEEEEDTEYYPSYLARQINYMCGPEGTMYTSK